MPAGRPTKYDPERMPDKVRKLCRLGATDYEIAQILEINRETLYRWKIEHEDFSNAFIDGKAKWDDRVERSLLERATGYSYESERLFCYKGTVKRVPVVEHVPPDPGAAKQWLSSRRPDKWRETTRQEITGADGDPFEVLLKQIAGSSTQKRIDDQENS